jgi:hypothetical protein
MKVRYIGHKDIKEDNVARSGAVWLGHGDVQEVPDAVWAKLSAHRGVWERVSEGAGLADAPVPAAPKFALVGADGAVLNLDAMDDEALHAFNKAHELGIDGRKKGDKLREAIVDAVEAKAKGE